MLELRNVSPAGTQTEEAADGPSPDTGTQRRQHPWHRHRRLLLAVDLLAMTFASVLAGVPAPAAVTQVLVIVLVLAIAGAYTFRLRLSVLEELGRLLVAVGVATVVVALGLHLSGTDPGAMIGDAAVALAAVVAGRAGAYALIRRLRRRRGQRVPVVVVGAGHLGTEVAERLRDQPSLGVDVAGFVDDNHPLRDDYRLLGPTRALPAVIDETGAGVVVVAFHSAQDSELIGPLRAATERGARVYVVPRLFEAGSAPRATDGLPGIPFTYLPRPLHASRMRLLKRALDVVLASALLVVAAPLLAAIALAVRLTSSGPILFRQVRVGRQGTGFEMLKFRSMSQHDEADTHWSSLRGDDRTTPVGRWLRRTSLDELPQLWNVVRGDMSLVGPRPERPFFVRQFASEIDGYEARHRVAPGITGFSQVNGLRGDTSINDRARVDNRYIDEWSPWRELSILLATVASVIHSALEAGGGADGAVHGDGGDRESGENWHDLYHPD